MPMLSKITRMLDKLRFINRSWWAIVEIPAVESWAELTDVANSFDKCVPQKAVLRYSDVLVRDYYDGHKPVQEYTTKPVYGLVLYGWQPLFSRFNVSAYVTERVKGYVAPIVMVRRGLEFNVPTLFKRGVPF